MSLADALDAWCKERAARLRDASTEHIMSGGKLDDPRYRAQFGEHRAYMAMRSFIHGHRQHDHDEG